MYKNEILQNWEKEGFDIQQMKYALEDGKICGDLVNQGYTQEDIENAHAEVT